MAGSSTELRILGEQRHPQRHRAGGGDALIAATLTGRAGTPEDVVGAVAFLASPAARQITGQVLAVNGGARTSR
ncbi:MAG: SDR family oxidoreductase [Streptosporangiaceae bacterium]